MWDFVIGPGGAVMFAVALGFLVVSTCLREWGVSVRGSTDRLATSRPVIHGIVFAAIVLGLSATAVRMGVLT
ncbi:hypothetical protein ACL02S_02695 [Nocardia sp. 004]|uniref:hypothetical protein n=1 Tax=Nocardia sp. 004 TaxID=3385978 RepID=UPI0039A1CC27